MLDCSLLSLSSFPRFPHPAFRDWEIRNWVAWLVMDPLLGFYFFFFFFFSPWCELLYIFPTNSRVVLELFHVSYCLVYFFSFYTCIVHLYQSSIFVIYVYVRLFCLFGGMFWGFTCKELTSSYLSFRKLVERSLTCDWIQRVRSVTSTESRRLHMPFNHRE